ncbi:730_t:CDS:2, partial [Acaulospora colombiana]
MGCQANLKDHVEASIEQRETNYTNLLCPQTEGFLVVLVNFCALCAARILLTQRDVGHSAAVVA